MRVFRTTVLTLGGPDYLNPHTHSTLSCIHSGRHLRRGKNDLFQKNKTDNQGEIKRWKCIVCAQSSALSTALIPRGGLQLRVGSVQEHRVSEPGSIRGGGNAIVSSSLLRANRTQVVDSRLDSFNRESYKSRAIHFRDHANVVRGSSHFWYTI